MEGFKWSRLGRRRWGNGGVGGVSTGKRRDRIFARVSGIVTLCVEVISHEKEIYALEFLCWHRWA